MDWHTIQIKCIIHWSEGRLFIEKGGYMYKYFKELIPPYTALIGCITGVISFIWLVVEKMILFFS